MILGPHGTDKTQRRLNPAAALIYAHLLPGLQKVARSHGYALAVHGSMSTDLDVIACPWIDDASDADVLIESIREFIDGIASPVEPLPSQRSHGRRAWSFYFRQENADRNSGPYIDISVMPKLLLDPK